MNQVILFSFLFLIMITLVHARPWTSDEENEEDEENVVDQRGKPDKPNGKKPYSSFMIPIQYPIVPNKPISEWGANDFEKLCKSKDPYLPSRQSGLEGVIGTLIRCYIQFLSVYIAKEG